MRRHLHPPPPPQDETVGFDRQVVPPPRPTPARLAGVEEIRNILNAAFKDLGRLEEVAEPTGAASNTLRNWTLKDRPDAIRVSGTGPRGRLPIGVDGARKSVGMGPARPAPPPSTTMTGPGHRRQPRRGPPGRGRAPAGLRGSRRHEAEDPGRRASRAPAGPRAGDPRRPSDANHRPAGGTIALSQSFEIASTCPERC